MILQYIPIGGKISFRYLPSTFGSSVTMILGRTDLFPFLDFRCPDHATA